MLTQEDDVEIHALARRGWSKSAIARHTGRDRKTIREVPGRRTGPSTGAGAELSWSPSARIWRRGSWMTRTSARRVLLGELVPLGFDRSYPTLVREIRELGAAAGVLIAARPAG